MGAFTEGAAPEPSDVRFDEGMGVRDLSRRCGEVGGTVLRFQGSAILTNIHKKLKVFLLPVFELFGGQCRVIEESVNDGEVTFLRF